MKMWKVIVLLILTIIVHTSAHVIKQETVKQVKRMYRIVKEEYVIAEQMQLKHHVGEEDLKQLLKSMELSSKEALTIEQEVEHKKHEIEEIRNELNEQEKSIAESIRVEGNIIAEVTEKLAHGEKDLTKFRSKHAEVMDDNKNKLFGGGALSAAAGGAVAGAIPGGFGGPAGAIVGALFGAATGFFAADKAEELKSEIEHLETQMSDLDKRRIVTKERLYTKQNESLQVQAKKLQVEEQLCICKNIMAVVHETKWIFQTLTLEKKTSTNYKAFVDLKEREVSLYQLGFSDKVNLKIAWEKVMKYFDEEA